MSEAGMTTAEYVVGTLGAVTLASILIHLGLDPWYSELIEDVVRHALDPTVLLDHLTR